jgi:ABC-type lipoprotein release transport system permease subunit
VVLLAILRRGENANALEVRRELEESAHRKVAKGAFYTTLDRLEKKKCLSRTREMGIRMSLGADAVSVRRLVIVGGLRLVAIGSAVGLVLAYIGARLVSGFRYGVDGTDPMTFVAVPLLLGSVALVAGYIPAYRASRVDPLQALRSD